MVKKHHRFFKHKLFAQLLLGPQGLHEGIRITDWLLRLGTVNSFPPVQISFRDFASRSGQIFLADL